MRIPNPNLGRCLRVKTPLPFSHNLNNLFQMEIFKDVRNIKQQYAISQLCNYRLPTPFLSYSFSKAHTRPPGSCHHPAAATFAEQPTFHIVIPLSCFPQLITLILNCCLASTMKNMFPQSNVEIIQSVSLIIQIRGVIIERTRAWQ